ncbi:MAG: sigma-70 family RNA polymerase sigma factor [Sphingomonadales bacterium]|nr:sigma-70 family RNA polymerase sigma factor [Sphingomonadales bacterium]
MTMEVNTGIGGLGNEETERDPLFGSSQAENNLFELRLVYADMRKSLMRFVARYLKKAPHDAEDIIQEVFVKAIEAQNKREIRFPKAYLYKAAKNLALKKLEKSEYRLTDTLGDLLSETLVSQVPSMDQQLEYREKFAVFCRAVGKLPERRRRAFVLRRVYGLSQKEIADEMNISLKTVEAHLTKAIIQCSDYMNELEAAPLGDFALEEEIGRIAKNGGLSHG